MVKPVEDIINAEHDETNQAKKVVIISDNIDAKFPLMKLAYDTNGNLEYLGKNRDANASDTDTDWIISKFTYDANGNLTQIKTLTGAWNERETLSW